MARILPFIVAAGRAPREAETPRPGARPVPLAPRRAPLTVREIAHRRRMLAHLASRKPAAGT